MPHFSQCIPTSNEVYAFGRQADTPSQPTDPAYVAYMLSLAAQPELNLLRPPPCVLYSACAGLCLFACKAIFQSKQEINYRLHWQRKRWAEKVWGTRGDSCREPTTQSKISSKSPQRIVMGAGGYGRNGVAGRSVAVKNNAGKKVAAKLLCRSGSKKGVAGDTGAEESQLKSSSRSKYKTIL